MRESSRYRFRYLMAVALAFGCRLSGTAQAEAPAVHPATWPELKAARPADPALERRIDALLARMTTAEKVGQLIQVDIGAVRPDDLRQYPLGSVLAGGDSGIDGDERAPPADWQALARAFRAVSTESRPGHVPIPVIFGIDAVHGHNNIVGAVLYPHNIALGAANDPELARRIGAATAEDVAATGIDWAFAPTVTVPQDRRWGRYYEGYSEDPALVKRLAAAVVEGLQGPPQRTGLLQSGHVAATAKHFIADGGTADGEDEGDAKVSEADLVATHLPGYEGALGAGVLTVMASFSSWQGTKMHANRALLTDVLKGRLGFDGFVIGDWNAHAQVPGCTRDHCPAAINAGVDMLMAPLGWRSLFERTRADVEAGVIPKERLDDAVRRILRVKLRLGLFDAARPWEDRLDALSLPAHRALAREAVAKSLVLLKNDGVLPIRAGARVLVTGGFADDVGLQSGGWTISWQGTCTTKADFPQAQSILAGLKDVLQANGGVLINDNEDVEVTRPDVAVVVFGENPYAEFFGDLKLGIYNNRAALLRLKEMRRRGIPTVSVFLSGRPLWVNPELNLSNAFVAGWWPGTEGGGVADVLVGDRDGRPRRDFTGRLPFRWPVRLGEAPYLGTAAAESLPVGFGLSYAVPKPPVQYDERL